MTAPPYINARVRIPSINRTGTITFIDWPSLYVHHAMPIQVALDEPWVRPQMIDTVRVWRTNTKDCEILNEEDSNG